MRLESDWVLEQASQTLSNWIMAAYAYHLLSGNNVHCRSIKAATVKKYLLDVAVFLCRFRDSDPRRVRQWDAGLCPEITKICKAAQDWEDMPNRKEPFTPEMLKDCQQRCANPEALTLLAAIIPWFILALYLGCRGGEWAQLTNSNRRVGSHEFNIRRDPRAFLLHDFEFRTADNRRLPITVALQKDSSHVGRVRIKFRTQKNQEHGEEKLIVRNTANPALCGVVAAISIVKRFYTLLAGVTHVPLSVYQGADGEVYNITAADIEGIMRTAAANVYDLDPAKPKDQGFLSDWTSHSLRIGACVILYATGFTGEQIQKLLRWKSTAFMDYLRNLAETSRLQNKALNDASTIPNFL